MIPRNIKEYFLPFLFCCVEASIAINKLKLLTLDSFSVTDIYRNILETALKSLRKVTVNLHAHHTEKEHFKYKKGKLPGSVTRFKGQPYSGYDKSVRGRCFPQTTVKDMNPQKNKNENKKKTYLTVCELPRTSTPRLPLGPRSHGHQVSPKPFPTCGQPT